MEMNEKLFKMDIDVKKEYDTTNRARGLWFKV